MKASGAYANLVQGVSQQAPHDRRDGQFGEVVNMILDPVNGMSRRHGSKFVAELDTGLSTSVYESIVADSASWRKFEYSNAGKDYVVMYRGKGKITGSGLTTVIVFNRTNGVFVPVVRPVDDPVLDLFESGGCSAITAIGKYVFAAGNTVTPTATTTDLWGAASNQDKAVVWIRGGGYSRTFKVTVVKTDNSTVNFSYTTPKSSYSGVLDTSKVPALVADPAGGTEVKTEGAFVQLVGAVYQATLGWGDWSPTGFSCKKGTTTMTNVSPAAPANNTQYAWAAGAKIVTFHSSNLDATDLTMSYTAAKTLTNPNYSSIVTAMTNAYNSAVTKHIGDAAEAVQPENIAEQLKLAAISAGIVSATRFDSTVVLPGVKQVTVQDGGDGALIRGVANEVTSADQVCNLHLVGKVVKVRARGSEEAYYLKAVPKDTTITSGYTEVTWVEGAGTQFQITNALIMGTASGGSFYIASSSALLNSILAGTHPAYNASTVGDSSTSPLPYFIGRKITYLGVFQDRLILGSGGVLRASRIGDYLNFFRTSVLTAPANDAFEMVSQGSEDDELKFSVLYDRDLVLFGVKRQYAVSGRTALSPSNANMPVMSSHEGAGDTTPIAAGNVIFYSKQGILAPSVHEIRPGQVAESPDTYGVSSQLVTYFSGTAIEMTTIAKPSMLFLRTTANRNSIFSFTYLDTDQGRKQDAWSRWDFSSDLGVVFSMTGTPSGLLAFFLRVSHGKVWVVADVCPVASGLATYPYLDSVRPWATVSAGVGSLRPDTPGEWYVAFDTTTQYQFLGSKLSEQSGLVNEFPTASGLWGGALQESFVIPTNPFVKDRNGTAVMVGRLTVSKLVVSYNNSSGFDTYISAGVKELTDAEVISVPTPTETPVTPLPTSGTGSPPLGAGLDTPSDPMSVAVAITGAALTVGVATPVYTRTRLFYTLDNSYNKVPLFTDPDSWGTVNIPSVLHSHTDTSAGWYSFIQSTYDSSVRRTVIGGAGTVIPNNMGIEGAASVAYDPASSQYFALVASGAAGSTSVVEKRMSAAGDIISTVPITSAQSITSWRNHALVYFAGKWVAILGQTDVAEFRWATRAAGSPDWNQNTIPVDVNYWQFMGFTVLAGRLIVAINKYPTTSGGSGAGAGKYALISTADGVSWTTDYQYTVGSSNVRKGIFVAASKACVYIESTGSWEMLQSDTVGTTWTLTAPSFGATGIIGQVTGLQTGGAVLAKIWTNPGEKLLKSVDGVNFTVLTEEQAFRSSTFLRDPPALPFSNYCDVVDSVGDKWIVWSDGYTIS